MFLGRTVEDASPYKHDYNPHQAVGVGAYDDPKKTNGGTKAPPYKHDKIKASLVQREVARLAVTEGL